MSRPLEVGDFAPWFSAPTPDKAAYHFNTVAGRYVILGFLPEVAAERQAALGPYFARRARYDDHYLATYLVVRDGPSIAEAHNDPPGVRWFLDPEGTISRLYGALDEAGAAQPVWLLLDPMLRVLARAGMAQSEAFFETVDRLPTVADYAGTPTVAPVLIVPRVFEHELCRRLIDYYQARGGSLSGVMRDVGGRTVGVLDGFKRRRDVLIEEEDLQQAVAARLARNLLPEVRKAFQFQATRLERYLIACYAADEGGYFRPHRDNESLATAHRRFAVSINLNAEEHEGGDLRFGEFGPHTYRPPTGGAVVFCCGLQHEATPVTKGRRYAFLPFLHDEAAERIRQANTAFLADGLG